MRSVRVFWLGVRLAFSGGRAGLARMILVAAGLAVGVALLWGTLSVEPAIHARRARQEARSGQVASQTTPVANATYERTIPTRFEGIPVYLVALSGVGDAPVPPGIPRLPEPGEAYVSPALADLLAGRDGSLLAPRVGNVVGTIADDALLYPGEVYGYLGAPNGVANSHSSLPIVSFAAVPGPSEALTFGALIVLCVFVLGMLLPIGLFIVTATRLSTSTREARLAAVRLAGATRSQIRLLAAAESAVAALIGCVVAWPIFLLGRLAVSKVSIFGYRWFPADFTPPVRGTIALLIGLPVFAVFVSTLGMRRLTVSPLGIVRQERRPRRAARWVALMAAGFAFLGVSARYPDTLLHQPSPIPGVFLGGALALVLVGLAGTVPWLGWRGAAALATRAPTPAVLLGSRRLESEPTSAGRVVAGITVLLALTGVAQALALSALGSSGPASVSPWAAALPASTVFVMTVDGREHAAAFEALPSVPGVSSVKMTLRLPIDGLGAPGHQAVVQTDGSPATLERIRDRLVWLGTAQTLAEIRSDGGTVTSDAIRTSRMMNFVTMLALLVAGASLLMSTVDGMRERRRPMAVLSAIGVPLSVIRRAIFVQIALPLAAALIVGLGVSVGVITLFFRASRQTLVLPVSSLVLTAAAVTAMVFLVTAIALPWARVSRSPELLRTE